MISGGVLLGLVITGFIGVLIYFGIYAIARDSDSEFRILPKIPRVLPWTIAARIRRAKAETELFEAKHTRLQKQLIYNDLENEQYKRALEPGNKAEN